MIFISTIVALATTIKVAGAQQTTSGKATYYGGNVNGNACGFNDLPSSSYPYGYSAAIGGNNFDDGYGCGGCYTITCLGPYSYNPGCRCDDSTPTVTVWASDQCPECSDTHFDLNPAAMERIVGDGLAGTCGEIAITIERVTCDFSGNIKIRAKGGTSEFWYGLHIDDVAGYGTISSVQLRSSGSSNFDSTCAKSEGASFWKCDGGYPLTFPLTVKLTDEGGRELTGSNVIGNANGGAEWDFGDNFDDASNLSLPTPTAPAAPTVTTPTAPTVSPPTAPTTLGASGTATTTRYWDCSGGACGCAYLPFGPGTDNEPAHCHSNAMFAAPSGNSYGASYYGTAAVSPALFGYGSTWLGEGCGKCWKLTGTSNIDGWPTFSSTIVLKGANLCPSDNPSCAGNNVHFDIAAPGFDVAQYSFAHTCPQREAAEDAGFSACESWMINSQNPDENCDCDAFDSDTLRDGCNNFKSLYWNNPTVSYEEVNCPDELNRLNCWEENGNAYPFDIPEYCAANGGGEGGGGEEGLLGDSEGSCLSGYTTVTVRDGDAGGKEKEIFLKELQIGNEILVDATQNKYEEVYALGHRDTSVEAYFLRIETSGSKAPLEITAEHLLYKMEESSSARKGSVPVRADSIKIGDFLTSSSEGAEGQLVLNITIMKSQGLYSPITKNGIFLANGLKVSSYTAIQDVDPQYLKIGNLELFSHHVLSHAAAAPLRFVCGRNSHNLVGGILCHERNERGQLLSVAMAERIALWWLKQSNMVFQGLIIATLTMLFIPLLAMEQIMKIGGSGCAGPFQFTWFVLLVVAGIVYLKRCQTKIKNCMK